MLSSPLTSPLIKERGIQSWWGPNTHFICGRKQNGASYDASFFIHPTKENPLPAYHASASNSQEADNSRKGDITQILQNVDAYEPRVKEFVKLIKPENCMLWKVAQLPDLSSWVSSTGRIVVLGDAAHAMSPHLGQGAAMSIEDGGVLSECLSRCSSISDIPMAVRVYERIQKPRAERVKKAAEISGVWKAMTEGKEREQRDKGFEERLRKGEKYEFFRASGHLGWLYGWDFQKTASKELDKAFPGGNGKGERAKI
jgi:salicylate hydroxylase